MIGKAVGIVAIVGLVLTLSVFFGYLAPTLESTNKTLPTRQFTDIPEKQLERLMPGEELRVVVGDYRLGLYRPTAEVWNDLGDMDELVYSPEILSYNEDLDLFVYWLYAPHLGCILGHTRKGEDEYSPYWLGGYYDIAHASSFDYAGRAIKDHRHAFRGLSGPSYNLSSPAVEIRKGAGIRVRHSEQPPQWARFDP